MSGTRLCPPGQDLSDIAVLLRNSTHLQRWRVHRSRMAQASCLLPVGYQTLLQSVKLNAAGSETVSSLGVSSLALQN
jgi:hypothetical protein